MYTTEIIKIKFNEIHKGEYDYSRVIYKNRITKVSIICKSHGLFEQTPSAHISGQGCPECAKTKRILGKRIPFEEFVLRAKNIHGDKFYYDESSYCGIESPLKITCPNHGEYTQIGKTHLNSYGCPDCGNKSTSKKLSLSKEEFIRRSEKVHGKKYSYDKVVYYNNRVNVIIICNKHGDFSQKPNYHLMGNGSSISFNIFYKILIYLRPHLCCLECL